MRIGVRRLNVGQGVRESFGIPSFSAQWMCAKLGGLAMMTSATKGLLLSSPVAGLLAVQSSIDSSDASAPVPSPAS
ncbi:hypothetical protein KC361_g78 [Hortaea werneckii]|nr:hypothetical protein KC361_g78 [Hortaea werneckii]